MIIGNGLLASEFSDLENNNAIVIFASGVSNSLEETHSAFEREKNLIIDTIKNKKHSLFVYFSTCSITDKTVNKRPYVLHKLNMEKLIRNSSNNYLIIRLPNIVGKGGNENTIFNYLVNAIKNNQKISIWKNANRNILDIKDMGEIVRNVIKSGYKNTILNIANLNSYPVTDIVDKIENYLQKKANINLVEKGTTTTIELKEALPFIHALDKDFSINYIDELLRKYH